MIVMDLAYLGQWWHSPHNNEIIYEGTPLIGDLMDVDMHDALSVIVHFSKHYLVIMDYQFLVTNYLLNNLF
jgi:hypothetical protein